MKGEVESHPPNWITTVDEGQNKELKCPTKTALNQLKTKEPYQNPPNNYYKA